MMQYAWKDAVIVLFGSTVHSGLDWKVRNRKKPAETASGFAQTKLMFPEGESRAELPIPTGNDDYNYNMNGVDRADQNRQSYSTQRIKRPKLTPCIKV